MSNLLNSPYTWVYFSVGICLVSFYLVKLAIEYFSQSDFAKSLMAMASRQPTLKERLQNIFVYSIAGLAILFAWPVFLIWAAYEKLRERKERIELNTPKFHCTHEFLLYQTSREEAEAINYIDDPLGTVPQVPFGHLNAAWEKFMGQFGIRDELWLFEITNGKTTGKYHHEVKGKMRGYARLSNSEIMDEFFTEID